MLTDEMKERSSANMSSTSHLTPIRWVHHENEGSSFSSPILRLKDISGSPSPGKRFNRRREPNYEGERSIQEFIGQSQSDESTPQKQVVFKMPKKVSKKPVIHIPKDLNSYKTRARPKSKDKFKNVSQMNGLLRATRTKGLQITSNKKGGSKPQTQNNSKGKAEVKPTLARLLESRSGISSPNLFYDLPGASPLEEISPNPDTNSGQITFRSPKKHEKVQLESSQAFDVGNHLLA